MPDSAYYRELASKIAAAKVAGEAAAKAAPNDGGSANLDHVVLTGLKGVREASLRKAGINARRGRPGSFHLSTDFGGQGQRNYVGVQAMYRSLSEAGVPCHVHYQID